MASVKYSTLLAYLVTTVAIFQGLLLVLFFTSFSTISVCDRSETRNSRIGILMKELESLRSEKVECCSVSRLNGSVTFRTETNTTLAFKRIPSCNCSMSSIEKPESAKLKGSLLLQNGLVYVYEIGEEYNSHLMKLPIRWWSRQYEPEYAVFKMFSLRNISRTFDPSRASLFYIPFLSARFTLLETSEDNPEKMKEAVNKTSEKWAKLLRDIKENYPFFNLSNGKDHFSVLTMDHGRCTALTFCDPSVYGEMFFLQVSFTVKFVGISKKN